MQHHLLDCLSIETKGKYQYGSNYFCNPSSSSDQTIPISVPLPIQMQIQLHMQIQIPKGENKSHLSRGIDCCNAPLLCCDGKTATHGDEFKFVLPQIFNVEINIHISFVIFCTEKAKRSPSIVQQSLQSAILPLFSPTGAFKARMVAQVRLPPPP